MVCRGPRLVERVRAVLAPGKPLRMSRINGPRVALQWAVHSVSWSSAMRRSHLLALVTALVATATVWVSAQSAPAGATGYQLPPKVIVDILDAAPPPTVELSPSRDV